jgi:SAM-dependent methyltransferase
MSEDYDPDNLLDRHSSAATLQAHYDWMQERERDLVGCAIDLGAGGDVLSVGAGWHPGRHLFPAPAWMLTANDLDPARAQSVVDTGRADVAAPGRAGELHDLADASFDVVLYRLVLHHVVFQQPLDGVFAEATRLLRPGGFVVAIEPGLWHPVGAGLALANRAGLGTKVHGTPDDIPLSPRLLVRHARAVGLEPSLHAVTYSWRRMPPRVQRALHPLDRTAGSWRGAARFGPTLLLLGRKPSAPTGRGASS